MKRADAALDGAFRALADATRRRLYTGITAHPGITTGELSGTVPGMTRWGVMKHLSVLRDAGLVQTLDDGRRRRHYAEETTIGSLREWLDANASVDRPR